MQIKVCANMTSRKFFTDDVSYSSLKIGQTFTLFELKHLNLTLKVDDNDYLYDYQIEAVRIGKKYKIVSKKMVEDLFFVFKIPFKVPSSPGEDRVKMEKYEVGIKRGFLNKITREQDVEMIEAVRKLANLSIVNNPEETNEIFVKVTASRNYKKILTLPSSKSSSKERLSLYTPLPDDDGVERKFDIEYVNELVEKHRQNIEYITSILFNDKNCKLNDAIMSLPPHLRESPDFDDAFKVAYKN